MEKSGSDQNKLMGAWETPGENDLSESILRDFKREFEECENALTKLFSYQKIVKLQDVKNRVGLTISQRRLSQESGDVPLNERSLLRLDDERIDQLYNDLVQTYVLKAIQDIEKISLATLDRVLSKMTFRENIEELEDKIIGFSKFNQKDGGSIHDYLLLNSTGLKPVIELKENEQTMMNVANNFMEGFHSMVSFPYIRMQFILLGLEEFIDSLEEIVQKAEDLLVEKYIKAQNKLHTNFTKIANTILESFKVTLEKGVEDEMSLSQLGNFQEASSRHQKLKKNLQVDFSKLVGQYFHASIFPPLFKPFFAQIEDQTDQQFNDLLQQKKLSQQAILNQNFEDIMFSVVEKELTLKQFQYLSQKEAQNAFCFVFSHIQLQGSTSPTIQLFTSLMEYLSSLLLIPQDPLVEESKMSLSSYENQNADSSEFKDLINSNRNLFIQYLERCDYGQAELVLVQIYLAISNIRIDHQEKNVKIGPFFGCLFDLRCKIATSLEAVPSLKTKGLGQFFAFLDCYFERKLIYQLGLYSDNIFEKAGMKIIIQDDQQDYNLLMTLRQTISEQSPEHEKQVIQEFHQAALAIKEKTKEVMPNQFYLKKVSDSYVRSRSIVIAASGFTSKEEDKQIKWAKIADNLPECEVYAVQYDSKTPGDLRTFIEISVASLFVPSVGSLVGGLIGKLGKVIAPSSEAAQKNPYQQAVEEARQTGIYLAHLLFEGNLFPNCTISFIGFSLGTQVISSCLQEYNKMLSISMKPSIVMSVAFLGGAADITDIKTSNLLNIISHRLYNCYSSKDGVLRYTLRLVYFFSKPLGLSPITGLVPNQQKKIQNFDLSSKVSKHLAYMKQIQDILNQIGFPYLL